MIFCLAYVFIWARSYASSAHVVRDSFISARQITKHAGDWLYHIRTTQLINHLLSDATEEQIGLADICVICRSKLRSRQKTVPLQAQTGALHRGSGLMKNSSGDYSQTERPKCLPCGHILHKRCLQIWFEAQATCPTCRRHVKY